MKHHFIDLLDRKGNYWTMVPNVNRYAYSIDEEITNKNEVKIITISKDNENWTQVFELPNLEELTLHSPSKEQLENIKNLTQITRLRITHARPKNIDFISELKNLEEIVFEYVSGFSDLSPLNSLKNLKSLHLENLRRVKDFDGLKGTSNLKYLHIDGTLDWKQPIEGFSFLEGLPKLEVFSLGFIITKAEYPAFLPILKLNNLKKLKIGRSTLNTEEYAFLEVALPNVRGNTWDLCWDYNDWFEFLGKGAGRVKGNNPQVQEKCNEFIQKYEVMKVKAKDLIQAISTT